MLLKGRQGSAKQRCAHYATELGKVSRHERTGTEKKGDLAGILTNLEPNDVFFIDEIHRLSAVVEENLYPAMEDLRFDVVVGEGVYARSLPIELAPFTLVGATTRAGLLTSPMRDRFGIVENLDFYLPEELCAIVERSAQILGVPTNTEAALHIAQRARGTPRIANRLLRRIRDIAEVKGDGTINAALADEALSLLDVDRAGFDRMDRKLLLAQLTFEADQWADGRSGHR